MTKKEQMKKITKETKIIKLERNLYIISSVLFLSTTIINCTNTFDIISFNFIKSTNIYITRISEPKVNNLQETNFINSNIIFLSLLSKTNFLFVT